MKCKLIKTYNLLGEDYYNMRKHKKGATYFYNELTETPTTFKLIGNVKNKKILDLGCGPGFYLKHFRKRGAKVKGIDLSPELLKFAKLQNPSTEIILGDITKKLPYKNAEFDIVNSSLVLGHIKNWRNILKEVHRILKKNGIFVFSIGVPFYECVERIKVKGKKFKTPKDYFNERKIQTIWKGNSGKNGEAIHYHKTYGTIIKLLIKNKFEIIDYEDCKPIVSAKKLYKKEYKDELNFPRFCSWKVQKK